jgi:hypothetical protein
VSDGLLNESAEQALRKVERDGAFHDQKNERILAQQRAYEGFFEPDSQAADWESKLHPPLINHSIETAMSMLVEDDIQFEISPAPQAYEGQAWHEAVDAAQNNEVLFRRQMGNKGDRFHEFQRPFVLQAAINRVSVAKTHWCVEKDTVPHLAMKPLVPGLGRLSPRRLRETSRETEIFNGPKTETVDLRDFYWNEAAVSLDVARYAAHAVWMSIADLQRLAKQGIYSQAAVDALDQDQADRQSAPAGNEIEIEREKRGRKQGLIEVLEIWDRDTKILHVIGARRVLLLQQDWPFWHRQFPFVTMSLAPFPFSIQGLSLVEKLADMQTAAWDLLNQTRDNIRLINNAIILLARDYDDPDSFEFAPGAINTVDRPEQVKMWQPEYQLAQVAMPLLEKLESDIQNLAMGQPISVPMSGRVTATEVATLSQIAQSAAQKMKDQVTYAYQRIGYQRLRLNQQYIRTDQHFIKKGMDGTRAPHTVPPHGFQGDFDFELKPSPDSAIRAERRAEAQSLMTLFIQAAPVMASIKQPLNGRAYMDKVLKAFDIDDTDEFYSAKPQAPVGPGGPPGGGEAAPEDGAGPGGAPVGVTGPNSINPAVSPSAQGSLSPGVAMARALASQGGLRNTQLPGAQ